jgi:hypothetical protein
MRLVHLARASLARGITRGGLAGRKIRLPGAGAGTTTTLPRGVYAMPVLRDSWTTLQWLRELRRGHDERMVAVYFHLPDDELVHVGRYNEPHQAMAVSAAAAWVTRHPAGAEIVVPRAIPARAIRAVREVGQLVGWTDVPEAERKLHCLCDYCFPRGDRRFMRRIRAAYADGIAAQRAARTREETIAALGTLETPLERARGRLEPTKLLPLVRAPDAEVRTVVAALLGHFRAEQVQSPLELLLRDAHVDVRTRAGHALLRSLGHAAPRRRSRRTPRRSTWPASSSTWRTSAMAPSWSARSSCARRATPRCAPWSPAWPAATSRTPTAALRYGAGSSGWHVRGQRADQRRPRRAA